MQKGIIHESFLALLIMMYKTVFIPRQLLFHVIEQTTLVWLSFSDLFDFLFSMLYLEVEESLEVLVLGLCLISSEIALFASKNVSLYRSDIALFSGTSIFFFGIFNYHDSQSFPIVYFCLNFRY